MNNDFEVYSKETIQNLFNEKGNKINSDYLFAKKLINDISKIISIYQSYGLDIGLHTIQEATPLGFKYSKPASSIYSNITGVIRCIDAHFLFMLIVKKDIEEESFNVKILNLSTFDIRYNSGNDFRHNSFDLQKDYAKALYGFQTALLRRYKTIKEYRESVTHGVLDPIKTDVPEITMPKKIEISKLTPNKKI